MAVIGANYFAVVGHPYVCLHWLHRGIVIVQEAAVSRVGQKRSGCQLRPGY